MEHINHSLIGLHFAMAENIARVTSQNYFHSYPNLCEFSITESSLKSTPVGLYSISNTITRLFFNYNFITSLASIEGVGYPQLNQLDLHHKRIAYLHSEAFMTPKLRILNVAFNLLVVLGDVTQYSWGNALSEFEYMSIELRGNPWNCNASLNWIQSNLYKLHGRISFKTIIYAKPPLKPYIVSVDEMVCHLPSERNGTTVVPQDLLKGIEKVIQSPGDLLGRSIQNLGDMRW